MFQLFVNRGKELEFLEKRYLSNKSELIIIYGRRRIGKTELILKFAKKKPHIYFLATEKPIRDNIKDLQNLMANYIKDELFKLAKIEDLETLFREFLKRKGTEKTVIIIDEFPILIEKYKPVISIFQRVWDTLISKRRDVMLILCGSSVGMMETEVLGYKSPLYGRRTGQWKVEEIEFWYLNQFFPKYTSTDLIKIYGVVGGIPGYLTKLNPNKTFKENLIENVFTKGSYLYEEAEILLKQELREPANYFAILKAISAGKRKFGEIVNETELDKSMISKYLSVLQNLKIVERILPAMTSIKEKTRIKRGIYIISDNYFSFWFRFIFPYKSLLESGELETYMKIFNKEFNSYLGEVFENLCRKYFIKKLVKQPLKEVGKWWHREKEIDIIGVTLTEDLILIETKWKEISYTEAAKILKKLKEKAENLEKTMKYGIIAKKIDKKEKIREKGYLAWDLTDIQPYILKPKSNNKAL